MGQILFFLLGVLVVCQGHSLTKFPSFLSMYADKTCSQPGLMCKNCKVLVNCIQIEDDKFQEFPVAECNEKNGEYCYMDQRCSNETNPQCQTPSYSFTCNSLGVFPDPYDCKGYHYCVKENDGKYKDYPYNCGPEYIYNMVTYSCDTKGNLCDPTKLPIPQCTTLGQTGALANPFLWYMCVYHKVPQGNGLGPELYRCPNGKRYNGKQCI